MSVSGPKRAERLLSLLQILHRHRYPVSGSRLAEELSVSLRTLYRDIASLRSQGADIQGEAGTGYILSSGYLLPPMMFTPEQLDALALGLRWVSVYGDADIANAASEVAGKVIQSIPPQLHAIFENSTLLVGKAESIKKGHQNMIPLRSAIRRRLKVQARYKDRLGNDTERILWPFALGYFSGEVILAAWCEMRDDFRHFNVEQLRSFKLLDAGYPYSRQKLLSMWRIAKRDILDEMG
ncbi:MULTISPECIES: helix-turn-helix transcriptional regulator [Lonsdalea]|uniref:DNA-binding protein n=1 Tax=Lonsdalea iberica TaxID=1082703 RepID=A0A1X3S1X4_9GAMM|nr:YafY family protein [Lonsdalea iberica]OSN08507.1 DNA-binding protein [Lonsdalea iberica]